jgi:hypothetical protein
MTMISKLSRNDILGDSFSNLLKKSAQIEVYLPWQKHSKER